jgi:hypothetical protein
MDLLADSEGNCMRPGRDLAPGRRFYVAQRVLHPEGNILCLHEDHA